ncbi:isochorismatase family protein [Brevibacterium aurantiacum]|uniref:isochorismatase n=1 Tax=Brevibacterium aurantiacum TaxID=273384 RepID=A0A556CAR6_BREAU|nr:isochorismatase family protein [Brevibacterium aurantiacum]TSI14542.1 isochorismatase family protein [Brevibacterium aurantiacum]
MNTTLTDDSNREIPGGIAYDVPKWLGANRVEDWSIPPDRTVLLVHDMQDHFVSKYEADAEPISTVQKNIAELIASARSLGVPVVYSAQPGDQDPQERALLTDFWGYGPRTENIGIIDALAPVDTSEVMRKWRYSAFQRTDLIERLRSTGRDKLVITGIYAYIGCMATALEAFMNDIQAFIVSDAVADFTADDHTRALEWVSARCGVVSSTRDLNRQWAGAMVVNEAAALLDVRPEEIGLDSDLNDLGLDSMRFIQLSMNLKRRGVNLPFENMITGNTISSWLAQGATVGS